MNNRETRKQIAQDTLQIIKQGYYKNAQGNTIDIAQVQTNAEQNTHLYSPKESDELLKKFIEQPLSKATEYTVVRQTTLDATRALIAEGYQNALCLNFASAKNAGGGFLGGSQAQEESIARSTGLYPCQIQCNAYYETNRNTKSCIYTDYMIYSPNVPIFKDEEGHNLEELTSCSIITAPAVNTGVVKRREPEKMATIEDIMKRRIRKVLAISLKHGHDALVLGAWGCGVFQNDPKEVASYFKELLSGEFKDHFKKIVFAVYSRNNKFIQPFLEAFGPS
ncbi:MAG: TIGR02452 family protein [Saprospiraceae bacterium]|nr:TIGR02452 family protein [Saprospiraceae bacterium]